jgi:hypothetical protein
MKTKPILLLALTLWLGSLRATEANPLNREEAAAGWCRLFDGHSLDGWKANEQPGTFTVVDGAIVIHGPRSHLFYTGPVGAHDFKNFELSLEILTRPGANSGVFIHTAWQDAGWPAQGYEVQVNNSHQDPKRTAGLYAVQDNCDPVAADGTWFTLLIRVEGRRVTTQVDGKTVCDFTEPADFMPPADFARRRLSHGTIALQGHDPASEVHYRNLRIRLLR